MTFVSRLNGTDPMNGIIKYFRENDLLQFISIKESSNYYGPQNPSSNLLLQQESTIFATGGNLGEYIEISFPFHTLTLSGYGIMPTSSDANYIRNWDLKCISNDAETVVSEIRNDERLCGKTTCSSCGTSIPQYYQTDITMNCSKIRLISAGVDSCNTNNYLVLSGIELFGIIKFNMIDNKCTSIQSKNMIIFYIQINALLTIVKIK